jgi:AAHS family 4-hydroxybenzoate transporter-like MFS transporter
VSENQTIDQQSRIHSESMINAAPLTLFQILVAVIGTMVLIVDGFDLQMLSYLMPQIAKEWDVPAAQQGTILSSGYLGVMAGYLALSPLSLKTGHKRMVVACLLLISLSSFLTLTATNAATLMAFRIATGVALGGVFPSAVALTSEYFPERYRASIVTIMYVGVTLGLLLAGAAAWMIVAPYGWRWAMAVGGALPLVLVVILVPCWPESIEFLVNRARGGQARARRILERITPDLSRNAAAELTAGSGERPPVALLELFRLNRAGGTVALWAALSLNSIVYFFVLSWLPLILVRIGVGQENAIAASSFANAGGIAAAFITGPLMDRFGGYGIVLAHFVAGAVFCAVVGLLLSPSLFVVVPAAFCLGFCVSGLQKGVSALAVRFYPAELRSMGLGWMFGVARSGAIAGPFVAGILMSSGWSPSNIFYLMSVPLLSGGVAIGLMWRQFASRKRHDPIEGQFSVTPREPISVSGRIP